MSLPDTAIATPASPPSTSERRFRSEIGQISRHSGVFFAGTLFTAAAGYLFKVYVARKLGAGALGRYALGMTIVSFFGLFNGLGLPQAAVRFVASYSATQQYERLHVFLRRTIVLLTTANIVLAGVMILVGPWLARSLYHAPGLVPYLPLFAIILLVGALGTFFGQVLAGYKDIARRTVITSFIASPLNILLGVVLLALGMGLRGYLLAQVASGTIVICLLVATAWKLTPIPARHSPTRPVTLEWEVFWFSTLVFGATFLEFLLSQADKIVMGAFLDVQQVGIYTIAASLVAFVPIALQSVNQIFSPTIAELHAGGQVVVLGRMFQTLTKWIIQFTLPLAFVVIIYSKALMRLFGPAFEAGWIVLIIGTLSQLVNTGVGSVGYLLLMSGNQRRLIRVQAIMAAFMITASLLLVRPFGLVGVAVASALTTAGSNCWYLREVRAALHIWPYNRSYVRLLLPSIGTAAVVSGLRVLTVGFNPAWLWIGVGTIVAYSTFCGLTWFGGLDDDDRMILSAIQQRLIGAVGKNPSQR